MSKKGVAISALIAAVVVVTAVVVVNLNNAGTGNAIEAGETSGSQKAEVVLGGEVQVKQVAEAEKQGETDTTTDVSDGKTQGNTKGMQDSGTALAQNVDGVQDDIEPVTLADASVTETSTEVVNDGEGSSEDNEIEEIEFPVESDIPVDWDWKTFPTRAPKKESSTTSPAEGGGSSGKDSTGKSDGSESSTTEGEPEGQSAEESSKSNEEGSTKEDVTEKSGEETSPEETSPVESNSEEPSSEETSTEETEPETTTLSPEEQASIVESAMAPIELPPIFFN